MMADVNKNYMLWHTTCCACVNIKLDRPATILKQTSKTQQEWKKLHCNITIFCVFAVV